MNRKYHVITRSLLCALGAAAFSACSDPRPPDLTPTGGELEDCPGSAEWLPNTPPMTLFKPLPHPVTECPFYRGVWQNFLIAMQPIDNKGTPALLTYPTIDTVFQATKPHGPNRAYLGDIKQAGGRQILVDGNGNSLYYGIHMNQEFADFIHRNHLETSKALQAYPDDPVLKNLFFPSGVVEFKEAWQIVDAANPPADLADYIVIDTTVPTLAQDPTTHLITEDKDKPRAVKARLLAIHVVYTYPGHPEFIWGSMEHSAGTPDTKAEDGMRNLAPTLNGANPTSLDPDNAMVTDVVSMQDHVLFKGGTEARDGNRPILETDLRLDPVTQKFTRSDGGSAQTSIYRMFPASKSNTTEPDEAITTLNHNVETLFNQTTLPSYDRRGHYRLLGGQWMDKPAYFHADFPIQNDPTSPFAEPPGGPSGVGIGITDFTKAIETDGADSPYSLLAGEDRMSSTAMESFTQGPSSFNNCFTCHNTEAITAKGVPYNKDFGNGAIKLLKPGLLNVSHILSQFILEDCTAPEDLVDNGNGTMTAVCH
jgi:hypothetical protein